MKIAIITGASSGMGRGSQTAGGSLFGTSASLADRPPDGPGQELNGRCRSRRGVSPSI
ncbi:MAG: hypothetical protein ACLTR6_05815 [Clostridium fessum]